MSSVGSLLLDSSILIDTAYQKQQVLPCIFICKIIVSVYEKVAFTGSITDWLHNIINISRARSRNSM